MPTVRSIVVIVSVAVRLSAGLRPLLGGLLVLSATHTPHARGEDISTDTTWEELRDRGLSLVFGRLEGRFDGPEYRGRKLRLLRRESGEEYVVAVEKGLGYFAAALPAGSYHFVAVEAVYFPRTRPMRPNRYPPVRQRYAIRPLENSGLPFFPVASDRPVYLGTIRSSAGTRGLVYEGHELRVFDEYDDALGHLERAHPELFRSLDAASARPERYFFVRPQAPEEPLATAPVEPLQRAREYIRDGKFRQAGEWLETFMPASDADRSELRMLAGEALLGDEKYPEAIEELGEVLLADPENLRALRLLARAHAFNGDDADAFQLYGALAKSRPEDAEAQLHLGYHHARRGEVDSAASSFDAAFRVNFDYLLHDVTPYALALRADESGYEAPEAVDGVVKPPSTIRSRRDSRGAFALLVDHHGRIVAAHVTPEAGSWARAMVMSVIRARFRPAKLNGVAIPCLVILGADNVTDTVK